jgi:hypothetical protein
MLDDDHAMKKVFIDHLFLITTSLQTIGKCILRTCPPSTMRIKLKSH